MDIRIVNYPFWASVVLWPWPHPFFEIFSGVVSRLSLGACVPNLKFVSLAILELLPFNAQKFTGSHDSGHAPSWTFFRGHVGFVHESMHAQFEKSAALALTQGHVTLATPSLPSWHSGVGGHQGTSFDNNRSIHDIISFFVVDYLNLALGYVSSCPQEPIIKSDFAVMV